MHERVSYSLDAIRQTERADTGNHCLFTISSDVAGRWTLGGVSITRRPDSQYKSIIELMYESPNLVGLTLTC